MSDPSPPDNSSTLAECAENFESGRNVNGKATLFLQYNNMVCDYFRRRLHKFRKLATRYDAEDLSQEVWTSILDRGSGQRLWPGLENLKGYLLGIAAHTFRAVSRAACRRKRDVRRTVHGLLGDSLPGVVLASAVPDPQRAREAEEAWALLTRCVPHLQRPLLSKIRDGCSHAEAAHEVGLSERTVRRLLTRLVPATA